MARNRTSSDQHQVRLPNLVAFAITTLLCSSLLAKPVRIDGVTAVVNGKPILHSQIQEKVKVGPLISVSDYPSPTNATAKERALNDAINFSLIIEAAQENDLDVSDEEAEREIARFLKMQGTTRKQLNQFLKQQGKSFAEYRQDFTKQILIQQFQRRIILPRIKVTDKDVEAYYKSKRGVVDPSQLTMTLQQIIVAGNSKQAMNIYNKVKKMRNFNTAVDRYSNGPKGEASYLKNLKLAELAPNIRNALVNLNKGDISKPVQSQAGFHLFYVVNRRAKQLADSDYEKLKPRLERELKNKKLLEQTNAWLIEARNKARVRIVKNS